MILTKMIQAKRKTAKAKWCKKDFTIFSEDYKRARQRLKRPMDTCWWCRHAFSLGDTIALACFNDSGNQVLCQMCANELETNGGQDDRSRHQ
jgi:hypothetical protein